MARNVNKPMSFRTWIRSAIFLLLTTANVTHGFQPNCHRNLGSIGTVPRSNGNKIWIGPTGGGGNNNNKPPPKNPYSNRMYAGDDDDDGLFHNNNRNKGGIFGGMIPLLLAGIITILFASTSPSTASVTPSTDGTISKDGLEWDVYWKAMIGITQASVPHKGKNPLSSLIEQIYSIFSFGKRKDKDEEQREAEELQLKNTIVESVKAPNSTLLPANIITIAAQQSGVIGSTLGGDSISKCASMLKDWYASKGYVLSTVMGATLSTDGTAELIVDEPILNKEPVAITFAKEMVIDDKTNTTMTFRKYKETYLSNGRTKNKAIQKSDLNTTFVETKGKTRPSAIAAALGFIQHKPFRWDGSKWKSIRSSRLFSNILHTEPVRLPDGTVQLQIVCQENPPRNLEYGVTKSLYTDSWEGELDFEHGNVFGGGEVMGVTIRRGKKEPSPSFRVRYADGRFGRAGGYTVEGFHECIAMEEEEDVGDDDDDDEFEQHVGSLNVVDPLTFRKGVSFNLQSPLAMFMERSGCSTSLERTRSKSGCTESILSTSLTMGPFVTRLPGNGRHSTVTTFSPGTRLASSSSLTNVPISSSSDSDENDFTDVHTVSPNLQILPYASGKITAREIFPLTSNTNRNPIEMAFSHSLTTSTPNLPSHEANAAGNAAKVRGYTSGSNGAISSSLFGTTELRIPLPLTKIPGLKNKANTWVEDATMVLFGDWLFARPSSSSSLSIAATRHNKQDLFRKSSIGIGFRKSIQGIPLRYDLSVTEEGKMGAFLNFGRDFDVF